jgi:UDP:flavonoid glycosyltransferase YjiC (YdhE family)
MSKILFAWELGANLGHLTRDLPLARSCQADGHDVVWAVNDLSAAVNLLATESFRLIQAPLLKATTRLPLPINYAAMLLAEGYVDNGALKQGVQKWLSLFDSVKPDAIIYNHAPTALLAAHITGIPVLICGTGFEIPPASPALPSFRPWLNTSTAEHHHWEQQLLKQINTVLDSFSQARLPRLSTLFAQGKPLLTTFAELDPFGPRTGTDYVGPVYALPQMPDALWSSTGAAHILAYLRSTIPGVEALLHALNATSAEVICAVPGLPEAWPASYPALRFYSHALTLEHLLPSADLMISYGATTLATALMAGVPVLLVPQVIEQFLSGLPLERVGAGRMLRQQRTPQSCASLINDLLSNNQYRLQAQRFCEQHAGHTQAWGLSQLKSRLQLLLANGL